MAIRADTSGEGATRTDNPTGDCTIFFRIRPAVVNRTFDVLFYAGDSSASTYENGVMIMFGDFGDRIEVWLRSTAFVFQQTAGNALTANNWYDVAVVYNTGASQAGNCYIWQHGASTNRGGSFTGGSAGTAVSEHLQFCDDPTGDAAQQTRIEGGRMWNAQLTEAELIRERFSKRAVRRRDLWGEWSLRNDSFGLTDTSGNGRNLTESGTLTVEDDAPGIPHAPWNQVRVGASPAGGSGTINTVSLTSNSTVTDEQLLWILRNRLGESSVSISDGSVGGVVRNRLLDDAVTVTEGSTIQSTIYNILASDELTIIDEILRWARFSRLLQDDVVITDDIITSLIGHLIFTSVLTSNISVTDEMLPWALFHRLLDSNVLTNDQALNVLSYTRDLLDGFDVFDDTQSWARRFILLTDALSVHDSLSSLVTSPTTDSPVIRIGFDQPRIEIGGYAVV